MFLLLIMMMISLLIAKLMQGLSQRHYSCYVCAAAFLCSLFSTILYMGSLDTITQMVHSVSFSFIRGIL